MEANRTYKDSVFRTLFNDQQRLLELFNAIEGRNYTDPSMVRITTLDGVFFANVKNDISFQIGDEFVILAEHQSTLNPNMPLRCLIYLAELYRQSIDTKAAYRSSLVPIPIPKIYTFYNGEKPMPEVQTLKLSDAFVFSGENHNCQLELLVRVFNINANGTTQYEILRKCASLWEYSQFIGKVRQYRKQNFSLKDAIRQAIAGCLQSDILTQFLSRHQKEVSDMLTMEFDYNEALKVREEEATERGLRKGFERGIERGIEQGIEQGIERGIERGIEQGIERGIVRGVEQGRRETKINTLMRQLAKKFDAVPNVYQQKLASLEQDQLDRVLDDIFDLRDISDLDKYFQNA